MKKIMADNCITCSKKFWWHEPVVCKIPEIVPFCIECSDKYKDNNHYDFEQTGHCWMCIEYEPDTTFSFDETAKELFVN